MTSIKDPKQVTKTIRHILLILISSLRVCFMSGRRGCRLQGAHAVGGMKGRFVGGSGRSAGTDEDCLPVNELNASNTGRTTVWSRRGRTGTAWWHPCSEGMSASRCALRLSLKISRNQWCIITGCEDGVKYWRVKDFCFSCSLKS